MILKMEQSAATTVTLAVLFSCLLSCSLSVVNGSAADGYTITGRIKLDGVGSKGFGYHSKISNIKIILNGGEKVTFIRTDGYFSLNPGNIQAALTENRKVLNELILEPLREEQYYEIREPFSVMSIVKSPMGLMIGFMIIVVFLMPKLMENIVS
ncbi:hypothetical protein HPP92_000478 [Vanilla planifolia]|uniref:ER membrane protein complex subunit 7 beta-sandwich domain-containing protein n=1 Tax=Vanilla planifolia TaxID=51239 RepID=A0A835VEF6_VANPL|nr:hypothetical protein HPP92_000478 [Vanilla planifolia]